MKVSLVAIAEIIYLLNPSITHEFVFMTYNRAFTFAFVPFSICTCNSLVDVKYFLSEQ